MMKFLLPLLFLSGISYAQGKPALQVKDDNQSIGRLNGNIKEIRIFYKTEHWANPTKIDTLIYTLNKKKDTGTLTRFGAENSVNYRLYDSKGKKMGSHYYKDGTRTLLPTEPDPRIYIAPTKQRPYRTEIYRSGSGTTDTTKYYYDKDDNLLRRVLTYSEDDYIATDAYRYDARGNQIEEKRFAGGTRIGEKNRLTSLSRTIYKYDSNGNWTYKQTTYPNTVTNIVSEGSLKITVWRTITYR